jgi:hypothetical protein
MVKAPWAPQTNRNFFHIKLRKMSHTPRKELL